MQTTPNMKRLLIPFLFIIAMWPAVLEAQSWCPPGAEWHYSANFCTGACNGYVRMFSSGDTIVQNQPCTKIERIRTYTSYFDPTIYVDTLSNLYTYSTVGIVWMFDPQMNAFDTLYDFNATIGDSWQLIHLPENSLGSDFLSVLDTGHVSVDGHQLRWLSVEYHFQGATGNNPPYLDTLIQRIGSNQFYMLPYDFPNGFFDGQEGGFFRCYTDNDISYQSPSVQTCDLPLRVTERALRRAPVIFPNPGNDQITVEFPAFAFADQMELYDAWGKKVLVVRIARERTLVDVSILPPGFYAYRLVNTAKGTVANGTWLKQ
jgi:hypothetical protein